MENEDELMESPASMHCKIFCAHCKDKNCYKTMENMLKCMEMRLKIDKYFEDPAEDESYITSTMSDNHIYG